MSDWFNYVQNSEQLINFYKNRPLPLTNLLLTYIGFSIKHQNSDISLIMRDLNLVEENKGKIKGVEFFIEMSDFQISQLQTFDDQEKRIGGLFITIENNNQKRIIYKNNANHIILDLSCQLIKIIGIDWYFDEKYDYNHFAYRL